MTWREGDTTNPSLLARVGDWSDTAAWREFVSRYDPLIRHWCSGLALGADETDEVGQRIWTELAGRMRAFRYDPGRTFRGWLRRLCRSRALDLLRQRRREGRVVTNLTEEWTTASRLAYSNADAWDEEDVNDDTTLVRLQREAEQAQAAVRKQVKPQTWEIFWRIGVEDRTVRETAEAFGMTYVATYRAHARVTQMLREEGERRLAALRRTGQ
jgi:RNA polymerase sigma-70 factor (ECF subfamily)